MKGIPFSSVMRKYRSKKTRSAIYQFWEGEALYMVQPHQRGSVWNQKLCSALVSCEIQTLQHWSKKLMTVIKTCRMNLQIISCSLFLMILLSFPGSGTSLGRPWWFIIWCLPSPSRKLSIRVKRQTSMNGMSWPKINQMSTIFTYAVEGSFSMTEMKRVVITNIVVRFALKAASKKNGLKYVVAKVIRMRRTDGK